MTHRKLGLRLAFIGSGKVLCYLTFWFLATTHCSAFQAKISVTHHGFSSVMNTRGKGFMPRKDFGIARTRILEPVYAGAQSFPDRFSRWRFMQDFLDGDVEDDEINSTLFSVLNDYLKNPPSKSSSDEESSSPEFTPELAAKLERALDTAKQNKIMVFTEDTDNALLQTLDELLPDPQEDEDGHKSAWDILMEMHGRELVKANEANTTPEWRKQSLVARLLIHYDFLTKDVS